MYAQSILLPLTCLLLLQASIATTHKDEKRSDFTDHETQENGCGDSSSSGGHAASLFDSVQQAQHQQQQQPVRRSDLLDSGNAGNGNGCLVIRQELDSLKSLLQTQAATIQSLQDRLSALETTVQKQNQTDNTTDPTNATTVVGFYTDFGNEPYHGVLVLPNDTCKFDRVLTNEGNGYDPTTGIFTAPVSGLYSFSLHFMGGDHDEMTNLAVFLERNRTVGVAYADGHQRDNNDQGSCSAVVRMEEGEGVSVGLEFGNPLIWGSDVTSFSGMLVQASV